MKTSRKNSKQRSRKLKKAAKRLAAYSAAAAATVMTMQNRTANAEEVVWDITDISFADVGAPSHRLGLNFSIIYGGVTAATTGPFNTVSGSFRVGSERYVNYGTVAAPAYDYYAGFMNANSKNGGGFGGGYKYADLLIESTSVTANPDAFGGNTAYPAFGIYVILSDSVGPFRNNTGFLGLKFSIGNDTHFGWAQISGRFDAPFGGSILFGFGYQDTPGADSHPTDTVDLPGDFNFDKTVDGNDLLLWQRYPSVGSLADWKANYGMGAPPLSAASSSVPEPNSILLLAAGAAGLGMWRKKRAG